MRKLYYYLRWLWKGKPMLHYEGFHCGCCGRWHSIPFEIPEYESSGEWWDTWGICPENDPCKNLIN